MSKLTHLDADGRAQMVDVAAKPVTQRSAIAQATVRMAPQTVAAIAAGTTPKGDVLAAARFGAIAAAKRTAELIPLCHPLPLDFVDVELALGADHVTITATARATARTGVEMEALTAASVAALTIYDMVKGLQKDVVIERIELLEKRGGRTGTWQRAAKP